MNNIFSKPIKLILGFEKFYATFLIMYKVTITDCLTCMVKHYV